MQYSIFEVFLQMPGYGEWVCHFSRVWWNVMPSSPVTLSGLASEMSNALPFFGQHILYRIMLMISEVGWLVAVYKLWKAFPGKF